MESASPTTEAAVAGAEAKPEVIDASFLTNIVGIDTSVRGRVADWVRLRATEPGITTTEIARRLGVARQTMSANISQAVNEGWLKLEDPLERIQHELSPLVIDNLKHFLKKKDKTVTLETAKGTVFKEYQNEKGISDAPQTILAIKFEPADEGQMKAIASSVVGKPKGLD